MKFMKLGSKPDQFQTDGDTIRYIATDLATDIVISVGDVKFYLHKFPLLSKSSQLQKLVASTSGNNDDGIDVHDIPGGPAAFEICAKFCYGMVVTLNAYNVVMARCAAEYLEMFETVEKGNLVYKIDVFLTSSIFRSWKDSIIVLQTTKSFLPWSEELKIVSHCLDSIATRASTDPSKVDWSYTYNRKKLPSENGDELHWNGVKKQQAVPKDWWVEDLCELQIDLYKRVITTIRAKGRVSADVVGESLKAYASRRLPVFGKSSTLQGSEILKHRYLVDTIIWLLPMDKSCVPCSFMLKLLQAAMMLECDETGKQKLLEKIGQQLEEATVSDLMIRSETGETALVNIDVVHDLVAKFLMQENGVRTEYPDDPEFQQICPGFTSDASKAKVAKLVDSYMAEAARDSLFSLSKFFDLAEMTSNFPRSSHDGIYRAIDMYLKEHPGLTKSEKKRICRLMDCRKLSGDASAHAVQNERLPLRVVVQILFFEQARAAAAGATPNLPGSVRAILPRGSCGSSRSTTTNSDEDWDGDHTSEELASLRLGNRGGHNGDRGVTVNDAKLDTDRVTSKKVKKIFSRLWSHKDGHGENSSSDTSASASVEEMKEVAVVVKTVPNQSKKNSLLTR